MDSYSFLLAAMEPFPRKWGNELLKQFPKAAGLSSVRYRGREKPPNNIQRQKDLKKILAAPKNEEKMLNEIISMLKGKYSATEIANANQSLPKHFQRKVGNTPALRKQRLARLEEAVQNSDALLHNTSQYAKARGMNVQTALKMKEELVDLGLDVGMTVKEKKKFVLVLRKFEGIA